MIMEKTEYSAVKMYLYFKSMIPWETYLGNLNRQYIFISNN